MWQWHPGAQHLHRTSDIETTGGVHRAVLVRDRLDLDAGLGEEAGGKPADLAEAALEAHVDETGSVVGFIGGVPIAHDDVLEAEVDLLVPAAVEGVLREDNAGRVRATVIVEGANGPTTPEADRILQTDGRLVVPDILANAGGAVVSYFEWVQGNQAYWWSEDEVESRLADRMLAAWHSVNAAATRLGVPLRAAATCLAVERVAGAHRLRGLYP